jgi:hypothetical protein
MIDRTAVLTLLNIAMNDRELLTRISDIADGLESAHVIADSNQDLIVGLWMTPSGAALLNSYSILPTATA